MKPIDADKIFDVLMQHAAAQEHLREEFRYFCENPELREFRFMGLLGFGGKYWIERNRVTCYPEDETPERQTVIAATNRALREVKD